MVRFKPKPSPRRNWRKRSANGQILQNSINRKTSNDIFNAEIRLYGDKESIKQEARRVAALLKQKWIEAGHSPNPPEPTRPQTAARLRNNRLRRLGLLPLHPKRRTVEW